MSDDAPVAAPRPLLQNFVLALRFGLVGVLNTAFGYGMYAMLVLDGLQASVTLAAATILGAGFNFYMARCLVFGRSGRLVRFVTVYSAVLAVDVVALRAVRGAGFGELAAQAIRALSIALLSFVGQRFWVFARETPA